MAVWVAVLVAPLLQSAEFVSLAVHDTNERTGSQHREQSKAHVCMP